MSAYAVIVFMLECEFNGNTDLTLTRLLAEIDNNYKQKQRCIYS